MSIKLRKRAIISGETIKIILVAGFIILLGILFFSMIAPNYSVEKEESKNYLSVFEKVIEEADRTGKATFNLWYARSKMVYFGSRISVDVGKFKFKRRSREKNTICFCPGLSEPGDSECRDCITLDKPVFVKSLLESGTVNGGDYIYFFNGGQYWKYDNYNSLMLHGFPNDISKGWTGIPSDIDAAVKYSETSFFFFKDDDYWRYDYNPSKDIDGIAVTGKISTGWPGIPSNIDAAVKGKWDQFFFIKGDRYWQYNYNHTKSPIVNEVMSPKEGKKISDKGNWDGLPERLEPNAAVRYFNYVYLFDGAEYWKFDLDTDSAVEGNPRETAAWAEGFENLDAAVQGYEISYRLSEFDQDVFQEGCVFKIFSLPDKYIFEVNCDYLTDGN
ncbi:hypothetical protein HN630_00840 [archaeon]|jgi:hypothetical protein|nr:hypothetical protein [archaeon]